MKVRSSEVCWPQGVSVVAAVRSKWQHLVFDFSNTILWNRLFVTDRCWHFDSISITSFRLFSCQQQVSNKVTLVWQQGSICLISKIGWEIYRLVTWWVTPSVVYGSAQSGFAYSAICFKSRHEGCLVCLAQFAVYGSCLLYWHCSIRFCKLKQPYASNPDKKIVLFAWLRTSIWPCNCLTSCCILSICCMFERYACCRL